MLTNAVKCKLTVDHRFAVQVNLTVLISVDNGI